MSKSKDNREVKVKAIATTEDTNDPVLRVWIGDSKADVIVDTEDECLNVWYIESVKEGDMKRMMDYAVDLTEYNWIQFLYPMSEEEKGILDEVVEDVHPKAEERFEDDTNNKNIRDVLEGFQEVNKEKDGTEPHMLVGFWET